ncbi:MAG: hypothetical protein AAGK74_06210, partial [Chloroflexota bacterium]
PDVLRVHVSAETNTEVEYLDNVARFLEADQKHATMFTEWIRNRFLIHRQLTDGYEPEFAAIRLEITGLGQEPLDVRVDDAAAPVWYYENDVVELRVDAFKTIAITVTTGPSDETVVNRPPGLI